MSANTNKRLVAIVTGASAAVEIPLRDLVAYSQEQGFTRLWLTGGHKIEAHSVYRFRSMRREK